MYFFGDFLKSVSNDRRSISSVSELWYRLRSLSSSGFKGASVPHGFDRSGREVLTFLEGDVATPPYPNGPKPMPRSPLLGVGLCCATTTSASRTSSSMMG